MNNKEFFDTSLLYGANASFVEDLYVEYLKNPGSVPEEWKSYFDALSDDKEVALKSTIGPKWGQRTSRILNVSRETSESKDTPSHSTGEVLNGEMLVSAYREKGHFLAEIDPLGVEALPSDKDIRINSGEFGLDNPKQKIVLTAPYKNESEWVLENLEADLKKVYCSNVAYEIHHIDDFDEKDWLFDRIENFDLDKEFPAERRKEALKTLAEVEGLEQFLQSRFPGAKRFSVEGGDASIICGRSLIEHSAHMGVEQVVFGMPHRGRLNMLAKVFGKPYKALLAEFQGALAHPETLDVAGDVKYHLGQSTDVEIEGKKVHISLTPNPSHLEAVNPVVAGKVRAKQDRMMDEGRKKALGVLYHGDAAFSGQGVVFESLMLSDLETYTTGGILHVVVNNQIGFTATPAKGRNSRYCTEVAKTTKIPIFHVNGNCPDEVLKVSKIAAEYRDKFHKDAVIDLVCYRLHGHNEMDEPRFTQPGMYKVIDGLRTPFAIYADKLISEGVVKADYPGLLKKEFKEYLGEELEVSKTYKPEKADWLEGHWKDYTYKISDNFDTSVKYDVLKSLGDKLVTFPESITPHKTILKGYQSRKVAIDSGKNLDWGCAEMLAFGSLLNEGHKVRITGQDSRRGTFSHRQSVIVDQENFTDYYPLNNISENQGRYEVDDSSLSEYAVMGFEYGYSITYPDALTIWEGQFGDFANTAQVIIDQFISSAETKWLKLSGLVLLMPHGYEGQGPEHSSARLERFMQLCAENNMFVCNLTTPANYFHALRRQVCAKFRKPLVIMTPKSLLRHKLAVSNLKDMAEKTKFQKVIADEEQFKDAKKIIFCSGKVYYDLYESRLEKKIKDVSIIRVEQLYPFPEKEVLKLLEKYKKAKEIIWCQEEPQNMGAWYFMRPKFEKLIASSVHKDKIKIEFVGRPRSASPAAGYASMHKAQQSKVINKALS